MKPTTVVVLGGYDQSLLNFRGPLLKAMVQAGYNVIGAAPSETPGVPAALAALGVRYVPMAIARTGLNPIADMTSFAQLIRFFRQERPDLVLSYTIKPVIYGTLAAWLAGVPRIYALITGLGAAFNSRGGKGRALRIIAVSLYRLSCARCERVLVQNREIAEMFIRERIVQEEKMVVVAGSGVDTQHFDVAPIPPGGPVFLLLARMLIDKGIEEYVQAAKLVRCEVPQARFLLVGDTDTNPAAIPLSQLQAWHREGFIEHIPAVRDVRPLLSGCTVYVLPSYHEGMPRSVLEAMAMGRPVITTDVIGCRETVRNPLATDSEGIRTGENGLLVPVRSVQPLARAMIRLALDRGQAEQMGAIGREIAVQQFDVRRINDVMLRVMNLSPTSKVVSA